MMTLPTLSLPGMFKHVVVITILLAAAHPTFAKRKDDVVVMRNGDKFTGEIKSLEHGELIFSSDYMKDSVHLDWKKVQALRSQDTFIVVLSNGERVTGVIGKEPPSGGTTGVFKIMEEGGAVCVAPSEVIAIDQRERSFWNQLTGSISYGFSLASGNTSTNSSLTTDVAFRATKNLVELATTSQFDSQAHAKNTNRFTFDAQYDRMLTRRWFAGGLFSLLKSNQQDLELRSTYGAGLGRKLIQTDRTSLTTMGGIAYSHERYVPQPGTEPVLSNAESLLGLSFSTFRFKTLNIKSQNFLFPSLSELGRVRFGSQSGLWIELVRNFNWNFQLYENYDSRPPISARKNDLGITTSLGWTF